MRKVSVSQTVVAVVALTGITVLGALGDISAEALVAIYSAVIGGALGVSAGNARNNSGARNSENPR